MTMLANQEANENPTTLFHDKITISTLEKHYITRVSDPEEGVRLASKPKQYPKRFNREEW
jgi:hypothetical protein